MDWAFSLVCWATSCAVGKSIVRLSNPLLAELESLCHGDVEDDDGLGIVLPNAELVEFLWVAGRGDGKVGLGTDIDWEEEEEEEVVVVRVVEMGLGVVVVVVAEGRRLDGLLMMVWLVW